MTDEDASPLHQELDALLAEDPGEAIAYLRGLPDSPEVIEAEDYLRRQIDGRILYPQRGMQEMAARSRASITFLGGAANSGKTWFALWWPTQFLDVPHYNCTYIRRDKEEIRASGGLWDEGSVIWQGVGAYLRRQELEAVFPPAASLPSWKVKLFGQKVETQAALEKKKGVQTCDLVVEEATGFQEQSFVYFLSRNRPMAACPKKPQCMATVNPDRDSWVFWWVRPWVDPELADVLGVYRQWGKTLRMTRWTSPDLDPEIEKHLLHRDGALCWVDEDYGRGDDEVVAWDVTYIQGSIYENRVSLSTDAGRAYLANLRGQDEITKARLLENDWLISSTTTKPFRRSWFQVVPLKDAPKCRRMVRSWDHASSAKRKRARVKADYHVGALVGLAKEKDALGRLIYVVFDVERFRGTAADGEEATARLAEQDGRRVGIVKQKTGGDEGERAIELERQYVVPGHRVLGLRLKGDKSQRADTYSTAAQQGRVYLVEADWNEEFLQEHGEFPG